MDGVIRIGAVNCGDNNHLCRRKGINSYPSLFIYRAEQDGLVKVGWMNCTSEEQLCGSFQWLNTLDSKEIYNQVINHLPDLQLLTSDNFQSKLAHHRWLVSRVDCIADSELCKSLYIDKPCVAVFKGLGINDFEIHHGKDVLYNIVGFARDSVHAHVTTLRPDNFPSDRKEPWLVDFFAPYNIQAYPTTVLFNGSSVHEYEGQHSADGILEFIQDLVHPSVVVLDPSSFTERVKDGLEGSIWLVDFYAPWCGPCQVLIPEWRRMARSQNVRAYPEIRLYPGKSRKPDHYMSYNGWHRDAHSLRAWALSSLPRVSVDLTPESFRSQVLSGQAHWVLDFYAPWCGPCQHFSPEFEVLAQDEL
uniref:DnaJ n=1 Tax=Larimichthys crocea TaxID=215358 RepID=A0A0F8CC73_LARCR